MNGFFLNLNSSDYRSLLLQGTVEIGRYLFSNINEMDDIPIYAYDKTTKHILGPLQKKIEFRGKLYLSSWNDNGTFEKIIDCDISTGKIDDDEEWFLRTLFVNVKKQYKHSILQFTHDRHLDGYLWNCINVSTDGIVSVRLPINTSEEEEKHLIESISKDCSLCFKTKRNVIKIVGMNLPISLMLYEGQCPSVQDDAFMEGFIEPSVVVKKHNNSVPETHSVNLSIICNDDYGAVGDYLLLKGIIFTQSNKMKKKQYQISNISSTKFLEKIRKKYYQGDDIQNSHMTQYETIKRIIISLYIVHLFEKNGYSVTNLVRIQSGELFTVIKKTTQRIVVLWEDDPNKSLMTANNTDADSAIFVLNGALYGIKRKDTKYSISDMYNLLSENPYGFDATVQSVIISELQEKNNLLQMISEKYEL